MDRGLGLFAGLFDFSPRPAPPPPYVEQTKPICWRWPVTAAQLRAGERINTLPASDLPGRLDAAIALLQEWQSQGDTHPYCAICGAGSPYPERVIDHDHDTGLVRRLLCRPCNIKEDINGGVTLYGDYRHRSPVVILGGIRAVYHSPFTGWAKPRPPRPTEAECRAATDKLRLPAPAKAPIQGVVQQ